MFRKGFMIKKLFIVCILLIGCGDSSHNEEIKANPCATPGATYLQQFIERSGNCGPITDRIINISKNNTIASSSEIDLSCANVEQDGCTARDTDCISSSNGITCSNTFITEFAPDGSVAEGVSTISCKSENFNCVSTYSYNFTRL